MRARTFVLFVLLLVSIVFVQNAFIQNAFAQNAKLEMKDLKALEQQKSWKEIVQRAQDVSPSERDGEWKRIVRVASISGMEQAISGKDPIQALRLSEAVLDKFPHLEDDSEFMGKRAKVGTDAFTECFQYMYMVSDCNQMFRKFVLRGTVPQEDLLRAGRLVYKSFSTKRVAAIYFAKAYSADPAKFPCDDEAIGSTLADALDTDKSDESSKAAVEVVVGCGSRLGKANLAKSLDNLNQQKAVCLQLLKSSALSGVQKARCEKVK